MKEIEQILKEFVRNKSQFFNLADGEEAVVKFLSVEQVVTTFRGNEVESIRYYFEVDGKELSWDRVSRELAKQMLEFSAGDLIKIKREGEKNKTKYFLEKVK